MKPRIATIGKTWLILSLVNPFFVLILLWVINGGLPGLNADFGVWIGTFAALALFGAILMSPCFFIGVFIYRQTRQSRRPMLYFFLISLFIFVLIVTLLFAFIEQQLFSVEWRNIVELLLPIAIADILLMNYFFSKEVEQVFDPSVFE